ncbi:MAG: hypothetical protein Q8Q49_01810 [bacterium]|nr:hypothetical protein [bacterium]
MANIFLWIWAFFISFLFFALFFLYTLASGANADWQILNSAAANTGITIVILSLAIGSISYFFPSVAKYIKYRKELGITGFFIIIFHIFITLFYLQDRFPFPSSYLHGRPLISFSAALASVSILIIMTIISNSLAIKVLGKWWRRLLRVGYIAIVFALLHMTLREKADWDTYLQNLHGPPPLSIIILWFGIWIILLRICVYFMTRRTGTHT